MDFIKTEPKFPAMLLSDNFRKFSHDEALNQNLPTLINIKKEIFDPDDRFYNVIDPSTSTNYQTDNIINIKTEPASIQSLQFDSNEIFSKPPSSKRSDAKDSVKLDLNQMSTSIIKHDTIDIKVESHGELDATPIPDLESSLISIKDENYENLKNFDNFTQNKCLVQSSNSFCNICGKNFVHAYTFNRHYREIHEKSTEYLCNICNKTFTRKGYLKFHKQTVHSKVKEAKCTYCDKSFASKSYLKIHKKKVHLKIHEKTVYLKIRDWKCNICDKYFTEKGNLKVHEEVVHLKIRRWKCNICEKSFTRKTDLKSHAKVHLSDYSEVCDICNKSVRHLRAHKYYMHSKTRAKNFKCTHCDKVFLQKRNLKQHMTIYLNVWD